MPQGTWMVKAMSTAWMAPRMSMGTRPEKAATTGLAPFMIRRSLSGLKMKVITRAPTHRPSAMKYGAKPEP